MNELIQHNVNLLHIYAKGNLPEFSKFSITLPMNDIDDHQVLIKYGFKNYYIDISLGIINNKIHYDCRVISEGTNSYITEYEFDHDGVNIVDAVAIALNWIKKECHE
jgi:hypothetical protein